MVLFRANWNFSGPVHQSNVWRKINKPNAESKTWSVEKHGGGSVILLGYFVSAGTENLQHVWRMKNVLCN